MFLLKHLTAHEKDENIYRETAVIPLPVVRVSDLRPERAAGTAKGVPPTKESCLNDKKIAKQRLG